MALLLCLLCLLYSASLINMHIMIIILSLFSRLFNSCRAKRAKCEESYHRKNHFEQGLWNVNTVLMGGLGGDPDATGSSSEEGLLYPKGLVVHVVSDTCSE